jgi:hypothetical protein
LAETNSRAKGRRTIEQVRPLTRPLGAKTSPVIGFAGLANAAVHPRARTQADRKSLK